MKDLVTLTGMILIMLSHSACRTSKLANRQNGSMQEIQQFKIQSHLKEVNSYDRHQSSTDSSGQSYQLTIFPADTFQFSIKNGFVGKASKVVLNGSAEQVIRYTDTSKLSGFRTSASDERSTRELTTKTGSLSALVKGKTGIWTGIVAGLTLGLLMCWIWRKISMPRSYYP
jgi:hypothetical protein